MARLYLTNVTGYVEFWEIPSSRHRTTIQMQVELSISTKTLEIKDTRIISVDTDSMAVKISK